MDTSDISIITIGVSVLFSLIAGYITLRLIPFVSDRLLSVGIVGHDLNKKTRPLLAEALGLVPGSVYLMTLFVFLPVPFRSSLSDMSATTSSSIKLAEWTTASLSICCMVLLGFADDVLNLKWKHKLGFPAFASLPLLMMYYVAGGLTSVVLPSPLRYLIGSNTFDLGFLYYIYMLMVAIFCTNSINILAGVNGLEVGQSILIAVSVLFNDLFQVFFSPYPGVIQHHLLSVFLLLPFLAVSISLYRFNRFPARVFVGDTYCYFAGMTFAVAGILGHYSKTLLLFFVPQIFNFLYSAPQLFGLIPCPRHRMPRLNPSTGRLEMSLVQVQLPSYRYHPSRIFILLTSGLGLLYICRDRALVKDHQLQVIPESAPSTSRSSSRSPRRSSGKSPVRGRLKKKAEEHSATASDMVVSMTSGAVSSSYKGVDSEVVYINNLTLINLVLFWFGPLREDQLTKTILGLSLFINCLALAIRAQLARLFYG